MRIYKEPIELSLEEAVKKLTSSTIDEQISILIGLAELNEVERIQAIYLNYLDHENDWIASAAILGLGHLARIHRNIDKNIVINELRTTGNKRPLLQGTIQDALDDINQFA